MREKFTIDLEVKKATISDEEFEKIKRVFAEHWGDDFYRYIVTDTDESEIAMLGCEGTLYGRENKEEAHNRIRDNIKKEIGECIVKTKWSLIIEDIQYKEFEDKRKEIT